MICKNGLHEHDENDPWRANNGSRCRECYRTTRKKIRRKQTLKGIDMVSYRKRQVVDPEHFRRYNRAWEARRKKDPVYRQMTNDTRRLGISRAEWRRQVAQGIIIVQGGISGT